jgi:hypothetical protein
MFTQAIDEVDPARGQVGPRWALPTSVTALHRPGTSSQRLPRSANPSARDSAGATPPSLKDGDACLFPREGFHGHQARSVEAAPRGLKKLFRAC